MIIRINGVTLPEYSPQLFETSVIENYSKKDIKVLKKLVPWLWTVAGTMMIQSPAFAAGTGDLWTGMKPVFALFQEIGMVLGAFAIIGGLIIMIFKKKLATRIIGTAAIAVAGVFLVPSAIMLLAIVGSMLNDALSTVFSGLDFGNSIKVGGR